MQIFILFSIKHLSKKISNILNNKIAVLIVVLITAIGGATEFIADSNLSIFGVPVRVYFCCSATISISDKALCKPAGNLKGGTNNDNCFPTIKMLNLIPLKVFNIDLDILKPIEAIVKATVIVCKI